MPPPLPDLIVIGAGVIGCASALAVARRGLSVTVVERTAPGAEASGAAAGIVGAQVEAHEDGPMARLCLASRARYAGWTEELREVSGLDVGYRATGAVQAAFDEEGLAALGRAVAWQERAGLAVERLDHAGLLAAEPALSRSAAGGLRFPDDAVVDPPALVVALRIAAERAGATFRAGTPVRRVLVEQGRACGVLLEDGARLGGDRVLIAAGSWSSLVEGSTLPDGAVRPARGQIVELRAAVPPLRGVMYGPGCYLSPRGDGRVLIGSTTEFVGFRPGVTAAAVRDLLAAATRLVPVLGEAAFARTWSGLRPHRAGELPLLGALGPAGLLVATGHFRNGILLAPITGELVAALVTGEPPAVDLAPFHPSRLPVAPPVAPHPARD